MKAMRVAGIISAIILFIYSLLLIGQLWGSWMDWDKFIKVTITALVLVVSTGIIALIYRELIEEKKLKKDNYID